MGLSNLPTFDVSLMECVYAGVLANKNYECMKYSESKFDEIISSSADRHVLPLPRQERGVHRPAAVQLQAGRVGDQPHFRLHLRFAQQRPRPRLEAVPGSAGADERLEAAVEGQALVHGLG